MADYAGGHVQRPMPLIIHRHDQRHTADLKQEMPARVLDALHSQQCIPWRVDRWMLDIQERLFHENVEVPWGTPICLELPPRVYNHIWVEMTKEEQQKVKAEMYDVYRANNQSASRRAYWFRVWSMFNDLPTTQPVFYPYSMDFRGRIYPRVAEGTVAGAEVATAVLERYVGEPVSDLGMFWLAVGVASYWGLDKKPFDERAKWANENWKVLADWIDDPHGSFSQWVSADKPLRFLALAREFVSVHRNPQHEVRRSVHLDGTCNGFQHLSAMSLDEETGKYVNLCPGPRQDLYSTVAAGMNAALQEAGYTLRANRSQVKRAVMTTPYGLTKYGMLQQLKDDGVFGYRWDPTQGILFRDFLAAAIEKTSGRAGKLMGWFQEIADISGHQNKPLLWSTPSGLRVRQAYFRINSQEITATVVPGVVSYFQYQTESSKIDRRKQRLSVAPNVTHSFDAAHLHHVVTDPRIDRNKPTRWINTIHDSFGIHPNYVDLLQDILKENFTNQYTKNWLGILYEDWKEQLGDVIPLPPDRGGLEISDVMNSEYIFS